MEKFGHPCPQSQKVMGEMTRKGGGALPSLFGLLTENYFKK